MHIERVNELFEFDASTGVVKWRKSGRGRRLNRCAGTVRPDGYLVINADREMIYAHRLAWALHTGAWPTAEIDHKNGNPSDNRICNLREATRTQNGRNSDRSRLSRSGHPNITWCSSRMKWQVKVRASGARKTIGRFDSLADAIASRDDALVKLHGEFSVASRNR